MPGSNQFPKLYNKFKLIKPYELAILKKRYLLEFKLLDSLVKIKHISV